MSNLSRLSLKRRRQAALPGIHIFWHVHPIGCAAGERWAVLLRADRRRLKRGGLSQRIPCCRRECWRIQNRRHHGNRRCRGDHRGRWRGCGRNGSAHGRQPWLSIVHWCACNSRWRSGAACAQRCQQRLRRKWRGWNRLFHNGHNLYARRSRRGWSQWRGRWWRRLCNLRRIAHARRRWRWEWSLFDRRHRSHCHRRRRKHRRRWWGGIKRRRRRNKNQWCWWIWLVPHCVV
jgi:hypothetical protein